MFGKRVDERTVVIGCPAKVNLYLEVLSRREDGYHNINSLFQAVSLFDRLRIRRTTSSGVTVQVTGTVSALDSVPTDNSNLVCQAFAVVQSDFALQGGLSVELEKNIPVAAGLAGGSSDAAGVILATNTLFGLGMSRQEMSQLGGRIGSDIPFFFTSGQAVVGGRGERIIETDLIRDYWLVLVTPEVLVSTSEAYAQLKRDLTNPKEEFSLPPCQTVDELVKALSLTGNDFEETHLSFRPELETIKNGLSDCGARLVRMSGSGPTIFGLFDAPPNIQMNGVMSRGDWRISTVWPIALPTSSAL